MNDIELGIPLYERVKREIVEAILQGELATGDVLPGEVALAQQFEVAVGTIRRALADLTTDGMLSRRRRAGTIVTGRLPQHSIRLYYQYFRLCRLDGTLVTSKPKVLSLKIGRATMDEAAGFAVRQGARVVRLQRVRNVTGVPVMHETIVLPATRLPGFPEKIKDVPDLLYVHLLERYGIRISAVREKLSAEVATSEDAERLKLSRPAAILAIDTKVYDQSGQLTIMSRHRASTTQFNYVNEVC